MVSTSTELNMWLFKYISLLGNRLKTYYSQLKNDHLLYPK